MEMASCEQDIRLSCESWWSQENQTALDNCYGHYGLVYNGTKRCKDMPTYDFLEFDMESNIDIQGARTCQPQSF